MNDSWLLKSVLDGLGYKMPSDDILFILERKCSSYNINYSHVKEYVQESIVINKDTFTSLMNQDYLGTFLESIIDNCLIFHAKKEILENADTVRWTDDYFTILDEYENGRIKEGFFFYRLMVESLGNLEEDVVKDMVFLEPFINLMDLQEQYKSFEKYRVKRNILIKIESHS